VPVDHTRDFSDQFDQWRAERFEDRAQVRRRLLGLELVEEHVVRGLVGRDARGFLPKQAQRFFEPRREGRELVGLPRLRPGLLRQDFGLAQLDDQRRRQLGLTVVRALRLTHVDGLFRRGLIGPTSRE